MKKVFKMEHNTKSLNSYDIKIIDMENETFTHYLQDKSLGFIYSEYTRNIKDMGYKDAKDCIKKLKSRDLLKNEVDYEEQKQSEKLGFINLGVDRIKRNKRVNTKDFEDVVIKLAQYGLGYTDAQNTIINSYLHVC